MMQAHPPPGVPLGALPRFARRLEAFLQKLDAEAPVRWERDAAQDHHSPNREDVPEDLPPEGEIEPSSSAHVQALKDGAEEAEEEEPQDSQPESSLPVQHFTPSRVPSKRRHVGVSSPVLAPTPPVKAPKTEKKTDESGFAWLRIQVPRPGYAISVRARPRWAGMIGEEVEIEEPGVRRSIFDGSGLDEQALLDVDGPAPSPPLSSVQFALGGDEGVENLEAFITSTTSPGQVAGYNDRSATHISSTGEQVSPAALPHQSAPACLTSSSGERSRSSGPETYSITSPSDGPTHPEVAMEDRSLTSLPLPALQSAKRLGLAAAGKLETPPHTDHLHLHRPFEQEADLTEASLSLDRSAEERNGIDQEGIGVQTRRSRQPRSKSATDVATSKPRMTRKTTKAVELPTAVNSRTAQNEPITPAPIPALAARALDFGQMTAITTPGDESASTALHPHQQHPAIDTPRSPTEKRSHLPTTKTGLRLLPGGAGSVRDQLRSNSESGAEPLRAKQRADDNDLQEERRRRASSSGGSPPATGNGNARGAGKAVSALSQTQSDSATDEEGVSQRRTIAKEAVLPTSRQTTAALDRPIAERTRPTRESHKARVGSTAAAQSRKGAHDAALLKALDREKGAALKRKADVASERLDRLQGQEKRIRGASRTLSRSESTAQERAKGPLGTTTGQGRLEMSNVPPEGAHKAVPLLAEASAQPSAAVRPSSSAPAANAAPSSSAVSATASKKHKSVPQRKPPWTSLEACVASWDQWIAEGRLPHAHPLPQAQGPTALPAPSPSSSAIHGRHPAPSGTPDGPHLLFAGMTFLVVHARYHAALAGTIERLVRRGGRVRVARAGLLQQWSAGARAGEEGNVPESSKDLGSITHLVSLGLPRSPSSEECAKLLGLNLPAPATSGTAAEGTSLQAQVNALLGRDSISRAGAGAGGKSPLKFVTGEWLAECQRRGRLVDEREHVSWRLA